MRELEVVRGRLSEQEGDVVSRREEESGKGDGSKPGGVQVIRREW